MLVAKVRDALPYPVRTALKRKWCEYVRGAYFGQDGLDRRLAPYLDYDGGFYVELGANDGATYSNTYHFELKRNWHGILIEPVPHNFLKCRALRGKHNHVYCNACVPFDYAMPFVEMRYSNLMSVAPDLDSDIGSIDAHMASSLRHLPKGEKAFTFGAAARTLNHLLEESAAPASMDLLSLDVEGAELDVLKGVDHREFRFKFMLIECRDVPRLAQYLGERGYAFVEKLSHQDYLFRDEHS
jgi:FkbM family methyltransferase